MRIASLHVRGLVIAGLTVLPAVCSAQTTSSHAPPNTGHTKLVAGTLARVDGNELLLKAKGGTTETYQLAPQARLLRSRPGQISDLRAGKFVGCTNLYGESEKRVAEECHIFPDGAQDSAGADSNDAGSVNSPEVSGPITDVHDDRAPGAGDARRFVIQMARNGGTASMAVTAVTVVTVLSLSDAAALKPGAKVRGIAQQAMDGTEVIQTLTVISADHG